MYNLPSAKFFQFANRMSCYQGVIKTLAEIERQQSEPSGHSSGGGAVPDEVVESDSTSLQMNFGDIMDMAEV